MQYSKNKINYFLLIDNLTQGGAERVAIRISEGLKERGLNIKLVAMQNQVFYRDKKFDFDILSPQENISKLNKIYLLLNFFKHRKNNFTICFSLDLAVYLTTLRFLKLYKGKIICRFINNPEFEGGSGPLAKLKKMILFSVLKKTDLIICQSNGMLNILQGLLQHPNMVRIYNPISIGSDFNNKIIESNENIIRLLFIGRFTKQKNLPDIIKIANELKRKNVNFRWVMVGDGELYNNFVHTIKTQALEDHFELVGAQSSVNKYYLEADITTLVSHYEGLPNVLLESICSGTPCVSYDCPTGPSEIIKNNINGGLVKQYDIEGFADKIIEISRLKLKNKNLKLSINDFDSDNIIDQYYELFKSL
ncbi:glycosyltransferase [Xenorhabdus nematophila]|uniref:glycosyltransferase n=1 Tax=Xenorhabdus nematophila TaxID=628 RepID=UPI0032B87704